MTGGRFNFRSEPTLPALAWVARIRPGQLEVRHGGSVRVAEDAFFEGTWAGPPSLAMLPEATTVFGSGIVARGADLVVVNPSHHLEGVYHARRGEDLLVANPLVGLLVTTGMDIDPGFDYPSLFVAASRLCWLIEDNSTASAGRLTGNSIDIPMRDGRVSLQLYENLLVRADLSTAEARKPREAPFRSFADYVDRLRAATRSLVENARPYEPVVGLSSGYDSTAVAAVGAKVGCNRAVGFTTARRAPRDGRDDDSGARTAATLGLAYESFDRLAYQQASNLPEAEFLSSGTAGEDTMFSVLEPSLRGTMFLTGYWAGTEFAMSHRDDWRHVSPTTTAGADLTEFRLRADFFHIPLPVFGAARPLDAPSLLDRTEMELFRLGGHYDRPIPRRLAEEAGVPRGSFGVAKRAANVLFPRDGPDAFSAASGWRSSSTPWNGAAPAWSISNPTMARSSSAGRSASFASATRPSPAWSAGPPLPVSRLCRSHRIVAPPRLATGGTGREAWRPV